MGYEENAESEGGYPSGYLMVAARLGLLKKASTAFEDGISRGNMAILVANALDINLLVRTSYGSDKYSYEKKEGATLISEYLDIYKYSGKITGNYYTIAEGPENLKFGQISVNGNTVFNSGNTNVEELVGHSVVFYAKGGRDVEIKTILSVSKKGGSTSIKIDGKHVLERSSSSTIHYREGAKEKAIVIDEKALIIYNGKPAEKFSIPKEGSITLISDDSYAFNVIIIEEYINLIVQSANADERKFYFKNAPVGYEEFTLLSDTTIKYYFINSDGTLASVRNCFEWDVLSLAQSEDGRIVKIIRSSENISGVISEIGDSYATLGDKEYEISKSLTGNKRADQLRVGLEGIFYLDFSGRIAAINMITGSFEYGYLVAMSMKKGIDPEVSMKIFTSEGKMNVFKIENKIAIVSGMQETKLLKPAELFKPQVGFVNTADRVVQQLIRYELNDEGNIAQVSLAVPSADVGLTRDTRLKHFTLDDVVQGTAMFLGWDLRTFLSRYLLGDDCIIFNVPLTYSAEDNHFEILNPRLFEHGINYPNLKFYDVREDNSISVLTLSKEVVKSVGNYAIPAIVKRVAKGINEYDEVVTLIEITNYKGENITLYGNSEIKAELGSIAVIADPSKETELDRNSEVKEFIELDAINKGDIIQYEHIDKEITAIAVRMRAEARRFQEIIMDSGIPRAPSINFNYTSVISLYGQVVSASEKGMVVLVPSPDNSQRWERAESFTGARLLLFDTKTKTVSTITSQSIYERDSVYVFRTTIYPKLVVVYG